MHVFGDHQKKQLKVIDKIEEQIKNSSLKFSTVSPVDDFEADPRICLTNTHIPKDELKKKIVNEIVNPLKELEDNHYFYFHDSLHMTIKNIRVIKDPQNFTNEDIEKARKALAKVIPKHKRFNIYFYRLLIFPLNLALIGTTDPELDLLVLDIGKTLNEINLPDDKKYTNDKYFFSNITLARFRGPPSEAFKRRVEEISKSLSFSPYLLDCVTLLTCNAAFKNRQIIETWRLT